MVISYKTGNLLVDEIEIQAQLLRNKIADIIVRRGVCKTDQPFGL